MDYPLLLSGQKRGRLKVEKQGLYTLMEARASDPGDRGLVRLWVRGGGKEAYLGLMEPGEDGLHLRRRLSRLELAAFPAGIEQATDRRLEEEAADIAEKPWGESALEARACPEEAEPLPQAECREEGPDGERAERPENEAAEAEKTDAPEKPREQEEPKPQNRDKDELLWTARRDGSLIARSGGCCLVALPARLRSVPPGARLRRIGGREYLVFRY